MEAATVTPEATDDTTDSAPPVHPVTFLAKRPGIDLVLKPAHKALSNERGVVSPAIPGLHAKFDPAQGNTFVTDDPEVIERLRRHRFFNVEIWEEGAPPDLPRPTIAEQMQKISAASVKRDTAGLAAVLDEENETHKRTEVLLAIKSALEAIADGD